MRKRLQKSQKFSNIFKRFTPFFEYFRIFSNIFKRFQTFSNVSILPILPNRYKPTPSPLILTQKSRSPPKIHPKNRHFSVIPDIPSLNSSSRIDSGWPKVGPVFTGIKGLAFCLV